MYGLKKAAVIMCAMLALAGCSRELDPSADAVEEELNPPGTSVFVSPSGSDENTGKDAKAPLKSIQMAVRKAVEYGYRDICLEKASFTPGKGLNDDLTNGLLLTNSDLNLIGGWISAFTRKDGKSTLDGNKSLFHIIKAVSVTNVIMSNLKIMGGKASNSSLESDPLDHGGGIFLKNTCYCKLENSVIMSNTAGYSGGGLFLIYSHSNTIDATIRDNNSERGAGLLIKQSSGNTVIGDFTQNSSLLHGGAIELYYATNNSIEADIYNNTAQYSGPGIFIWNSSYNTVSGKIFENLAYDNFHDSDDFDQGGGGIYFYNSRGNRILAVVSNNQTTNSMGGGIYLKLSDSNTIEGPVVGNESQNMAGGIMVYDSSYNQFKGDIRNNQSENYGGGIYIYQDTGVTISNIFTGTISLNTTGTGGGGIYQYQTGTNDWTQADIRDNQPDNVGVN